MLKKGEVAARAKAQEEADEMAGLRPSLDPIQRSSARAKQLHSRGALPIQAARAQGRLAARISARL